MFKIRWKGIQAHLSTLLLIAAAAAMVATSPAQNTIEAESSGVFQIPAKTSRVDLFLSIEANKIAVDTTSRDIPWQAFFEYTSITSATQQPAITTRVIALPGGREIDVSGYTRQPLEHPDPCAEGADCSRRFKIIFSKRQPQDAPTTIEWTTSAEIDWGDEEVPQGANLKVSAEPSDPAPVDTGAEPRSVRTELQVSLAQPTTVFPIRFIKSPDANHHSNAITVSSELSGDHLGKEDLRLIPDDPRDPEPDVDVGRTVTFDPFIGCQDGDPCVVGYKLELEAMNLPPSGFLRTTVSVLPSQDRMRVEPGGVAFEAAVEQRQASVTGVVRFPAAFNYETSIANVRRVPRGTPMEVIGRLEARLLSGRPRTSVEGGTYGAHLKLTKNNPTDGATFNLLPLCVSPCREQLYRNLYLGSTTANFYARHVKGAKLHYTVMIRLRFPGADDVPDAVKIAMDKVYESR